MAKKRAPAGNGVGSAKRVKGSISAVPTKPKAEAPTNLETFEDALEVGIPPMPGMEARKENVLKDSVKGSEKGSSIENDGDFHSQYSETHEVSHSLDTLESVEGKNNADCEVSRMIDALQVAAKPLIRIYTLIGLPTNKRRENF